MSKQDGMSNAIKIAIDKLKSVNLEERCNVLGLPQPVDTQIPIRAFGTNMLLKMDDFSLSITETGKAAKPGDLILILHYLEYEFPIQPKNELISFRDFPGGQFYMAPFQSRSVNPLVSRFKNDLESLKGNLDRFDWEPVDIGDLGAKINAFGCLSVTLVYRLGDEEFPPSAELFFDASVKKVFNAEDAAVMASRICIGLL